ncbi:MAG TPA: 4-(cytidine 5'-diphospho)-2-C-methyl-D-erythritol kinase [Novosphingobium sp.]|nr:4-(cytidine 5'-diphospho)-2-C-methyl-D-erythritol kinase [Novosphingobium sp.]
MKETAYAKINLALHVRRKRGDGYHEIETLFAFVDAGDELTVETASRDELHVTGEFAGALADPFGNIVAQALGKLPRPEGWRVTLDKRLPVAAGLGGGSADAGAVFRLYDQRFGLPDDWRERAAKLGADVPACVDSRTAIGLGTGTDLQPGPDDLAGTPVLLVNPRLPLATGPVFAKWDGIDRGTLPEGTAREIALAGRNDLESPALALCPAIGEVLSALRKTGAWLERMSGSGATCFALFDDAPARDEGARSLRERRPEWWQMSGALR